jgi:hypothetical protein
MVKEADVESVPKRNPTHSFRNHSLSQPSASAVPDLRSTRKNTTSPHEHLNALLGIVTAREYDSEKSSDASAVGGDGGREARHVLPRDVRIDLPVGVRHVQPSVLVLSRAAKHPVVAMPK